MTRHYAIGGTSARESLLPAGSFERRARFSGSPLVRSRVVREASARYGTYEPESSERRALGSVSISADAHWTATLTVPMAGGVAFVDLERRGALPRGYRGGEERAQLALPVGEVDALVALLSGVVAHARRDGVLPSS